MEISKTSGDTQNYGFTRITGNTRYFVLPVPDDFQIENGSGWVTKKYRVAGRVQVPAGHCPSGKNLKSALFSCCF